MRALVTGSRGQLGRDLCRLIPDALGLARQDLSIDNLEAVRRALVDARPDVVFNCAAYNGVDAAERDSAPAVAINALGAENVAVACRAVGAKLVHFSTNYVFDGTAEKPYCEDDEPNPRSAYARSKRDGERLVLAALPSALVIRSSGLFGLQGSTIKGGSFPERILARARAGEALRVVDDQRLNPTFTSDLAAGALRLVEQDMTGIVHLVAAGCCSWWDLAVETVRLAGLEVEVAPVSSDEFPAPAARPGNGCLRSARTPFLRGWREGLAECLTALGATSAQWPVMMPRP